MLISPILSLKCLCSLDVAHPQSDDLLLAGQRLGVLDFSLTIVKADGVQRIGGKDVRLIAVGFRAILLLIRRRYNRPIRICLRLHTGQVPVVVFCITL